MSGQTGFGVVTYHPGGSFGPFTQSMYQLVVIHRGQAEARVDGKDFLLEKGAGVLVVPGHQVYYQFSRDKETTHSWCQLPTHLLPAYFSFPPHCLGKPAPCSKWQLEIMKDCGRLPSRYATGTGLHAWVAGVLQMMWHFCEVGFRDESTHAMEPEALLRVSRLIANHLSDRLTLSDLTKVAAVSKGHLIKLASEHWGTTPMEKLWMMRLEEAARLLSQTGLSVAEVAYRTGFANPFHFSRRFKAQFGQHPQAWRQAAWHPEVKSPRKN